MEISHFSFSKMDKQYYSEYTEELQRKDIFSKKQNDLKKDRRRKRDKILSIFVIKRLSNTLTLCYNKVYLQKGDS